MTILLDELRQTLANGLIRRASTNCSRWSMNYVVMGKPVPGPFRYNKHPWSEEWFDVPGNWVGMKAAQMAMTTAAICRAIWTIDIKKVDVLYVLPKKNPDAADFSKSKFDPIVENSPHLSELFDSVKNVGHKQAGSVNLFIRGSRSRSGLKSISVGLRVYDEYDEMVQRNVSLADERSSGFEDADRQNIRISTPTIPDYGVDVAYQSSTQEHYFFRCPYCSRFIEFLFPESLIITTDSIKDEQSLRNSHYICTSCKHQLHQQEKPSFLTRSSGATWRSTDNAQAYERGFQINQLYSCMIPPWEIAKMSLLALEDPAIEQEFYNSKLGRPHLVAGAKIDLEILSACYADHSNGSIISGGLVTMGVDVGKYLHVQISQWMLPENPGPDLNTYAIKKPIKIIKVTNFEDLDRLMYEFQVLHCVIDANPETRKAKEFADRFAGHIHLCYFLRTLSGKTISENEGTNSVSVRRTPWLDLAMGRYRRGHKGILLPRDTPSEYKTQIGALARVETKDSDGNAVAKWVSTSADHFAFANLYDEIALPLAVSITENKNVNLYL